MSTSVQGLYRFDEADAELSLLPMAARRALDVAGRHLSLSAWATLSREARVQLITLGAAPHVDVQRVAEMLDAAGVQATTETPRPDPPSDAVPALVASELAPERFLDSSRWQSLSALDRYVLWKHASRGKRDRLAVAYDEILGAKPG